MASPSNPGGPHIDAPRAPVARAPHGCGDATGHPPCFLWRAFTFLVHSSHREPTMTVRRNLPLRVSVLAAIALALACSERPHPAAPVLAADATTPSATQATSHG